MGHHSLPGCFPESREITRAKINADAGEGAYSTENGDKFTSGRLVNFNFADSHRQSLQKQVCFKDATWLVFISFHEPISLYS